MGVVSIFAFHTLGKTENWEIFMDNYLKLCYVDEPWAYFTTKPLDDQWGNNWNDAPYEHSSGPPYKWRIEDGQPWEIVRVAYSGDVVTPSYGVFNSGLSVEDINRRKAAPWLRSPDYVGVVVEIWAGCHLKEFIKLIRLAGGDVYMSLEENLSEF